METAFMDDGIERIEPRLKTGDTVEEVNEQFNPFEYKGDKHKPIFNIHEDVKNRHKFKHKEYISIRPPESRIEAVNRSLEEKFDNFRERVNNAIPPGTGFEHTLDQESFYHNKTADDKWSDLVSLLNRSNRSETCESPTHVDLPYYSGNESESRIIKPLDKNLRLDDRTQSIIIDNDPEIKSVGEIDIEDKGEIDSATQETASITRGPSPKRRDVPATILNSLSKLPPKYSAPKAKRVKDINLMLYKPYLISRIHIDRKKYELDQDFENRVKLQQQYELLERDIALRQSNLLEYATETKSMTPQEQVNVKFQELLNRKPRLFFS